MGTRFTSIDVIKAIAAIAVVIIHFPILWNGEPKEVSMVVKSICRFAVPIFFCVSGYFYTARDEWNVERQVKKVKHIALILLGAISFYVCFALLYFPAFSPSWSLNTYIQNTFSSESIVRLAITHTPLMRIHVHLWFLYALLVCYLFTMTVFNKNTIKLVYVLCPLLLALYYCMQEFRLIDSGVLIKGIESRIYLFHNFIFRGLPFFFLGIILRFQTARVSSLRINLKWVAAVAIAGSAVAVWERFLFTESQYYVGSFITCLSLMIWSIKNPSWGNAYLAHIGRDLSLYIYILHIAVGRIVRFVQIKNGVTAATYDYLAMLVIILATILVSEVAFRLIRICKSHIAFSPGRKA